MKQLCLFFFLALALAGCSPAIPSDYIQPDRMEDILYDYQIAQAMGNQSTDGGQMATDVDKNVYKMAVLKKYGVSQKQFDTSLAYYMRHTEQLHKIYENLAERLSDEAVALGSSVNDINQYGSAQQGDTTNVWNKASAFILSTDDYLNQESFTIKADSSYHKGDRLMLNFESQFVIQDGSRDAIALIAVTLANDSVVTQTCRISSNGHQTLTFNDTKRLGIKLIRGFFLINRGENDSESTLKLLCLYNIQLVRMHTNEETPGKSESLDNAGEGLGSALPTDVAREPQNVRKPSPSPQTMLNPQTMAPEMLDDRRAK